MDVIIAVDFDGTIVDHRFPDIGQPVPGAFHWLKRFKELGAKLILWTVRDDSDSDGPVLSQAFDFCRQNGVEFDSANCQIVDFKSPKVYAGIYIDDAAFGCPLKENPRYGGRPYVDWSLVGPEVEKILLERKGGAK